MLKRYTFWLWATSVIQLLTAAMHSLSFFNEPVPNNETEKQFFDLANNYKFDMGSGFHHSFADLVMALSIGFALLFLLGGLLNIYLLQKKIAQETMKGVTGINTLVFGICFLATFYYTFLPPIIMTGLVFIGLCFSYATNHIHFIVIKQE